MKRVLSWLCLLIALAALPTTAHAASTPGDLYLSYKVDGGSWHFGNKMTKSGNTWTYTLPETTSSNVEFAINTVQPSNENGLKQYSTQYCAGDSGKGNKTVASSETLYLYGNSDHWLKYDKEGIHTFTLTTTDGDSSGYTNLQLNITTSELPPLYLNYKIDNGSWVWATTPLSKTGDNWSKTFDNCTSSVEFAISIKRISSENDIKGNKVVYYNSSLNDNGETTLYLYGDNGNSMKINKPGTHTIIIKDSKTKGDQGYNNLTLSYSTKSIVPTTLYLFANLGDGWKVRPDAISGTNKVFTGSFTITDNEGFVRFCSQSNGGDYFNADAKDKPVTTGETYGLTSTGDFCFKLTKGNWDFTVDFSAATPTVVFTYKGGGNPVETFDPNDPRTRKSHLPLKPSDFANGKKHYFLVGNRMGDWRLQPEWELLPQTDGTYAITDPRVVYNCRVGVAMVDNYLDYSYSSYHRYQKGGYWFKEGALSADLSEKEIFQAYDGDNFRTTPSDDVDYILADRADKKQDDIQYSTGVVMNAIRINVNSEGKPTNLTFDMDDLATAKSRVPDYITFSLVGSEIRNWGMPDANKTEHGSNDWQDAWVQYDPESRMPYRDAKGNLIYQTCFQSSWLDEHPTFFNKAIGDDESNRDFNYTSQSITMRNAKSFSADELKDDTYAALYDRFGNSEGTLGGSRKVGDSTKPYNYTEKIISYDGTEHNDERTAKYECYVVKDMWMSGAFKVWTGWGGGIKKNEHAGVDNGDARWYFVNGGHGKDNTKYNVNGYDITTGKEACVYGTYQDKPGADFNIPKLTYFKRVIVWYDPDKKFENASAIQLIREQFGPQIQAFRGTLGHQIDRAWNISDEGINGDEFDRPVKSYTVDLYRYNTQTKEFEFVKTVDSSSKEGMKVRDFTDTEHPKTGTDSNLEAGTYRYKLTIEVQDDNANFVPRDAWSNRVTLYEASQPVNAKAYQRTETENGKTLYSFDVVLDLDLKDGEIVDGENVYSYNKLVSHYLIKVPDGKYALMNSAIKVTVDDVEQTPVNNWFKDETLMVYKDGKTTPENLRGIWLEIPVTESNTAKKVVFHNLVGATPQQVFDFDIYLRPLQNVEAVYAKANFEQTHTETTFNIPDMKVEWGEKGISSVEATTGYFETPDAEMPLGAHHGSAANRHAPVHYNKANSLYATAALTETPVTQSVKDAFGLNYNVARGAEGPEVFNNTLPTTIKFENIDITALREKSNELGTAHDGKEYFTLGAVRSLPLSLTGHVEYVLKSDAAKVVKPLEPYTTVTTNVELTELAKPQPTVSGVKVTTVEQNATDATDEQNRYFVQDLYATVELGGTSDLVFVPGFHVVPSKAHGISINNKYGSTTYKSANGGVVAYKGMSGIADDHFSLLDETNPWYAYTPYVEGNDYVTGTHNWAVLGRSTMKLPLYVSYFSVKPVEKNETWRTVPDVSGYATFHYPFLVNEKVTRIYDDSANTASLLAAQANETPSIVTLTAVAPISYKIAADEVMTAISEVTADGDRADAEFFNLQGIRVMNPVPGQVYLVRRGADVTKVLYK